MIYIKILNFMEGKIEAVLLFMYLIRNELILACDSLDDGTVKMRNVSKIMNSILYAKFLYSVL